MRAIIRIARLEWSNLFYSPIAWLVLVVFTFQSGLELTGIFEEFVRRQGEGKHLEHLTREIFTGYYGFFPNVQKTLYLYVPLLTMGLMSREISSGSIKLLLSSPVTTGEIVLGKFIAMMGYCFILIFVLFLCGLAVGFSIRAMDVGMVFSGLIGLYLLVCAYAAIGLFMSCLTAYQVVAAISTLVTLAALNYVGNVAQHISLVRDITYFLSISGRSDQFINGLVSSKGVLYFLIVISLFLGLAVLKLQSGRDSLSPMAKAGRYVGLIGLILVSGYLTSRPLLTFYYDMTAGKSQTLSVASQDIIKKFTSPLKITTYTNILDDDKWAGMPERINMDLAMFEQYQRFMPDMRIDYRYYYDSSENRALFKNNPGMSLKALAGKVADASGLPMSMFLSPEEMKKEVDLKPEEHRFVRLLTSGDKKTFLRLYSDMARFPGEAEISASLKRLVTVPPKILCLSGNNERDMHKAGDKDYKTATTELTFRKSLINQGFDVDTLSLEGRDIPRDISALVIADPSTELKAADLSKIEKYISDGGNLMVAGEPGRQAILNPLIRQLGVQFMPGTLIQENKEFSPNFVLLNFSETAARSSEKYRSLWADSAKVSVSGAVGLAYEKNGPYTVRPILLTNPENTWNKLGEFRVDTGKLSFDPRQGDCREQVPVALALTRRAGKHEQRIMIFGDADFMSNTELRRYEPRTSNFELAVEVFKWFSYGEFPVDIRLAGSGDNKMEITREGVDWFRVIFLVTLPVLLVGWGAVLLIRRKRN